MPAIFAPRKLGRYLLRTECRSDILPVNLLQAAGIRDVLAVDIGRGVKLKHLRTAVLWRWLPTHSIMSGRLKDCASQVRHAAAEAAPFKL